MLSEIKLEMPSGVMERITAVVRDYPKFPNEYIDPFTGELVRKNKGKKKLQAYYDQVGPVHTIYELYSEFTSLYEELTVFGPTGDMIEKVQRPVDVDVIHLFSAVKGEKYIFTFEKRCAS